jgi:amidophosphoribosyltransferase
VEVAGIVAICNLVAETNSNIVTHYLAHSMQMLQHRGKAYWKMVIGNGIIGREGSLPPDDDILKMVQEKKLCASNGIGYLSKRSPQFPSMNTIHAAIDGFFVDTFLYIY